MKKLILYGAGRQGEGLYDYLVSIGKSSFVETLLDENPKDDYYNGCTIKKPEQKYFDKEKFYVYISIADKGIRSDVEKKYGVNSITFDDIAELVGKNPLEFSRNYISFYHINHMEWYYDQAESEELINVFWGKESIFLKMFNELNLENVIEIACGHGRHLPHYIMKAGHVTMVDINRSNIDFCKDRFSDEDKISYYVNNGFDLRELDDSEYTSVFSYDSFVHFELLDIYSYLKDIYRVLVPGGRALIHHSNQHDSYKDDFANAYAGRNFMSSKLFAYIASKSGFKVLDQQIIDWQKRNLDCVSLIEK